MLLVIKANAMSILWYPASSITAPTLGKPALIPPEEKKEKKETWSASSPSPRASSLSSHRQRPAWATTSASTRTERTAVYVFNPPLIPPTSTWKKHTHPAVTPPHPPYRKPTADPHTRVTRSRDGPGSCPDYCNGGVDWPPECISSITGHKRHP